MAHNEQRGPAGGRAANDFAGKDRNTHSTVVGSRQQARMVKLAELWERASARGSRCFSGFMGDVQLLLFDAGERDPTRRPGAER